MPIAADAPVARYFDVFGGWYRQPVFAIMRPDRSIVGTAIVVGSMHREAAALLDGWHAEQKAKAAAERKGELR